MKRMLQEFRVAWSCGFACRGGGKTKYWFWFLFALSPVIPVITWYETGNLRVSIGSLYAPFSLLFVCTWLPLISGLIRQNSSANAKLVPKLHRRLIQLTVASGLSGIIVNAYLIALVYSNFGWCLVAMLFLALSLGWGQARNVGWMTALFIIGQKIISEALPPSTMAILSSDSALIAWIVLGLLLNAVFIKSAFPRGGDRSWLVLKNAQRQFNQAKEPFAIGRDAGRLALAPYNRALRVACTNRLKNLAMLTLGPNCHWGALFIPLLLVVVVITLSKIFLLAFPASKMSDFLNGFEWNVITTILIVMQFLTQDMAMQFSKTRVEQSLFRLGAYAPPANILNRTLASGIVRAKLQGFFLTLFVALACSAVMGVTYEKMITECTFCCLTLPFICLHLRDYSREAMMNTGYARIWQFLGFLIFVPGFIILGTVTTSPAIGGAIIVICIALSAVLIPYRWRNMVASPVAFPAGRFET
jgi:hypothetical protein